MSSETTRHRPRVTRQSTRRALGMAEVLVSMLIVSGLLVSALNTLGSAAAARLRSSDQARGQHLAQDLMSEILSLAYEEPVDPPVFGPEGTENGVNRAAYDDVDDYVGHSSTTARNKTGVAVPGFDGWTREVDVAWANTTNLLLDATTASQVKRITVRALRNGKLMATLTALKTAGPPAGNDGPVCVFVATDPVNPNAQEALRIALIESWGYTVAYIKESDKQSKYDTALVGADLVYVSSEANAGFVGSKLNAATIGIVSEAPGLVTQFGFGGGISSTSKTDVNISANTHAITNGLTLGNHALFATTQPLYTLTLQVAPGINILGYTITKGIVGHISLAYFDTADALYGGGVAVGRRVMLPWGNPGFDFNSLTTDAQTIMHQAMDWAAGTGGISPNPAAL